MRLEQVMDMEGKTVYDIDPLQLEGGINFRDMGGYQTEDGRKVRKGLLYRSGALNKLTDADLLLLEKLLLKTILDYRDESEIENSPDRLWKNAVRVAVPAISGKIRGRGMSADLRKLVEAVLSGSSDSEADDAAEIMIRLYEGLPFDNPAYRRLFLLLAEERSGSGLLQHCTAGKDRTGVGSALTLLALGVPLELVRQDYLETDRYLDPFRRGILARLFGTEENALPESAAVRLSPLTEARGVYFDTAMQAILKNYGSFENYFENELGLSRGHLEGMRERYLE